MDINYALLQHGHREGLRMPRKAVKAADRAKALLQQREYEELARYTVDHATDPRFNDLDMKETHFRGTMYDRRPFDWQGRMVPVGSALQVGATVASLYNGDRPPVALRRPNSKYAVARIVVSRFASMLFGNRVFPRVRVVKSKQTEQYLNGLLKQANFKARMLYAAQLGGAMGSVITMFKVIDGRFRLEVINSKWVVPLWADAEERELQAFSVCYPVMRPTFNAELKMWVNKPFLYRRLVTTELDIEFELQPAKVTVQGTGGSVRPLDPEIAPTINVARTVYHGFGFVPAEFIQHTPRHDQTDGDAACETTYDMIDRINENLAAVHHAMQGNLDPTLVLKVTPEDYKKLLAMGGIVRTGADGEGLVVGDKGDAKYVEITAQGITIALEIIDKLINFVYEASDCVVPDPYKVSGAAQSAAAIQLLFSKMIDKADTLRTQYGDNGLKRILSKMIKAYFSLSEPVEEEDQAVVHKFKSVTVEDPKTKKVIEVTPEDHVDYDDIELVWGQFFEPTSADIFQLTEAAVMATGGKAVTTQAQAARTVAPYFQDHALDSTISELEDEQEEIEELQAMQQAANMNKPAPKRNGNQSDKRVSTPKRKA